MPNYDLYTELSLDKDMPPAEIGALLDDRINTLLGQGYQRNSPEVDQLSTARAILSDPGKRNTYEAALAGPDGVVDVAWLHNLADSPGTSGASATSSSLASPSSPSSPSYEAAATSVISTPSTDSRSTPQSQASEKDAASAEPASPESAPESSLSEQSSLSGDLSAGTSGAAAGAVSGSASGPVSTPFSGEQDNSYQYNPQQYGQPQAGQYGQQSQYGQPGPQGQPGQYGSGNFGQFTADNSGNFGAPVQPGPTRSQFNPASLSVAGRVRSQSKAYLVCLAIMVLGMIYPLIIMFTAGSDDVDSVHSILKALMFTVAHAVAWVGIAEIVWGVRRIVAPEDTDTSATGK